MFEKSRWYFALLYSISFIVCGLCFTVLFCLVDGSLMTMAILYGLSCSLIIFGYLGTKIAAWHLKAMKLDKGFGEWFIDAFPDYK